MYLSTTQILKRLGIERNKKNADIVRKFFANDFETIGGVNRVSENLYYDYEDNLKRCFVPIPQHFNECQISSVTNFETTILNQDKRILDLESEIALLKFRLEKAESAISNIIGIFYNISKLKGE